MSEISMPYPPKVSEEKQRMSLTPVANREDMMNTAPDTMLDSQRSWSPTAELSIG